MNSNARMALILSALIGIWMLSGLFKSKKEDTHNAPQEDSEFAVETAISEAQPYAKPILVRAVTEAERSVVVAAEVDGLIEATPIAEGVYVEKGQVLCRLRREDREARAKQARAALAKAELDFRAAESLSSDGFQSKSQIASYKAALLSAEAESERAELMLSHLDVIAPFAGLVQTRLREAGDFIQRGGACAQMLDLDPIIVAGELDERDVIDLKLGDPALVRLSSDRQLQGSVRYISHAASANTRTFKIEAEVANPDFAVLAGLSADMNLKTAERMAHRVSPALLILLDDGDIGLRAVNNDNVVVLYRVELLAQTEAGVWLTGLPDKVNLIVVGHQYVSEGEKVSVVGREIDALNSNIDLSQSQMRAPAL